MGGEMISFTGNGTTYEGYLARAAGGGPGVIVLQEWWGLVGHIKSVVDRFAEEGITALAPDLYQGESTSDPDEAGSLMMALNIAETEKALRGAVDALLEEPKCTSRKVGVVGFCMGGQLSLYAAATNPKIGACVDFYGIHPNVHPPLEKLDAPVLGFFAEHDAYASPESMAALSKQLDELGKPHEFHLYTGAHHAFFNDDRQEVYNEEAAKDAWERTLLFFDENL
ncbi:MAG: dienelactone hydrolase family protein [Fimbriimonadaceae bacterium]|nr:dienelactone hydrolase family protein [Fimbriimonadaceae bacterium]